MRYFICLLCWWSISFPACAAPPSVFIEDMTWTEVRDAIAAGTTTAIYYAGSTEQNGPHMAIGKHNVVAHYVAGQIARRLGNALVYPTMPFAPTGHVATRAGHMRFPGSVSVSEATYAAVARDLAESARAAGFTHVVLMGDHGGGQNTLATLASELDRQWSAAGTRVYYIADVYFAAEEKMRAYLEARGLPVGAHAGLPDTSELMFIDADRRWIRTDRLAPGDGHNGVDGDPRKSSSELGRTLIEFKTDLAVDRIRQLVSPTAKTR